MSPVVAQNGHGPMSDLSPLCAPKRTSADHPNLWVHPDAKQKLSDVASQADKTSKSVDDFNQKAANRGDASAQCLENVQVSHQPASTLAGPKRGFGMALEDQIALRAPI
jgi:hypothetical protein